MKKLSHSSKMNENLMKFVKNRTVVRKMAVRNMIFLNTEPRLPLFGRLGIRQSTCNDQATQRHLLLFGRLETTMVNLKPTIVRQIRRSVLSAPLGRQEPEKEWDKQLWTPMPEKRASQPLWMLLLQTLARVGHQRKLAS